MKTVNLPSPIRWSLGAAWVLGICNVAAGQTLDLPGALGVGAIGAADSFFGNLFKTYMPRHMCMFEETSLIWLHVICDAVIALAYFSIPIALVTLVRKRRELKFNWIAICFAIFILACGFGHVLSVIAIWNPFYRLDGVVKAITAVASVATAAVMWPLIPKLLALPTRAQMQAAEAEQRLTADRLMMLVESAKEYAIFMLDPQGMIKTWNAGAERLKGYRAEEIIGKHFSVFYTEQDLAVAKPQQEIETALRTGQSVDEGWRVRADGTRFQANVTVSTLRDENGAVVGFSKITRDVTERKAGEEKILELNKTLQRQNLQLETTNKELEAFSYSVSHDLRAPLRSIDGFSRAILEDCADALDDSGRDHLNRVRAASQRMGNLIDDLLNLSRVSRGILKHESTDLSQIAREVVSECQNAAQERHVSVKIADGLVAEADSHLMRVVLTNLIGNAWKFSGKNENAAIEFGRAGENGQSEYFVRDNGAGFDMTYASKLFGAFQRLHTEREYPGTGIGLATVQRIIHRHGGHVRAESAPGQGATFYFTIEQHNGVQTQLPEKAQ